MPAKGYTKPPAIARKRQAQTRLSEEEAAHFEALVAGSRVGTEAEYLRRLIMGEKIPRRSAKTAGQEEMTRQLAKIGGNLNQLARAVNSGHAIEPAGFQATVDELRTALAKVALGE